MAALPAPVTSVIVGAKRPDQLLDTLAVTEPDLSGDEIGALNVASTLPSE